jgi:hypothetical protein
MNRPHLTRSELMITVTMPHLWPPDHTFVWNCLIIIHTFHPLLQFFLCLNLKLMSMPQRWLRMGWFCLFPLLTCHVISLLSLPSTITHLFTWGIRLGGWNWPVEPPELGLWPRMLVTSRLAVELGRYGLGQPRFMKILSWTKIWKEMRDMRIKPEAF